MIREMWRVCFPGDERFDDWFFHTIWNPEDTLILEKDNKPAAMVQMIPITLSNGENAIQATYIYGAGTMPEFRKQGLMAALLTKSFEEDKRRQHGYSVLIPANEPLFAFYKKFSYEPVFSLSQYNLNTDMLKADGQADDMVRPLGYADISQILELYQNTCLVVCMSYAKLEILTS